MNLRRSAGCSSSTSGVSDYERTVRAAFLCDARERDLAPLEILTNTVRLQMPGTIATIRLLT